MIETFETDVTKLTKPCRKLTFDDANLITEIAEKIDRMWDTGWVKPLAVAANQVGYDVQFSVVRTNPHKPIWLINSEIIDRKGLQPHASEGCLSIPNRRFVTWRYLNVTILNGIYGTDSVEFTGLEAQVVQHEIDHFKGILCVSRQEKGFEDQPRNEICLCGSGRKFKKCHGV